MQYFDPETGESYVPYVVETSIGVDRMVLQVLSAAYREEQLENGESRVVLAFPPALAPVKVAVMPLVKKDGLPDVAQRIIDQLKYDFNVVYDEKGFDIGKRYRRQDAVWHAVLRRRSTTRRSKTAPSPCVTATRRSRSACWRSTTYSPHGGRRGLLP